PRIHGLSLLTTGNTTQRFALVNTTVSPRYASSGATILSAGGMNLLLGAHQIGGQPVGYAASITSPRYWAGSITFIPAIPCSGQVVAGTASALPRSCPSEPVDLSLTGNTVAAGITYQWESSPAGTNTWSPIPGATSSSYTENNQTADTDYRCIVTCTNSNTTDTSTTVFVAQPGVVTANFYENFD